MVTGASFRSTSASRSVNFSAFQSEAAGSLRPIAQTFSMDTNFSTTDSLALARSYLGGELSTDWRIIGRRTYARLNTAGTSPQYREASAYVVPLFENRSDFDPMSCGSC
jgi:hypothetical protein